MTSVSSPPMTSSPSFDPEYRNTYELLKGYSSVVGGFFPPLVDYGSGGRRRLDR